MKEKRILPSSFREEGGGANFPVAAENEREKRRVTEKNKSLSPPRDIERGSSKKVRPSPVERQKEGEEEGRGEKISCPRPVRGKEGGMGRGRKSDRQRVEAEEGKTILRRRGGDTQGEIERGKISPIL